MEMDQYVSLKEIVVSIGLMIFIVFLLSVICNEFFIYCYNKDPYTKTTLSKINNNLEIMKIFICSSIPLLGKISVKTNGRILLGLCILIFYLVVYISRNSGISFYNKNL